MSINFKDRDMVATYKAWDNMKRRCLNPSCRSYRYIAFKQGIDAEKAVI